VKQLIIIPEEGTHSSKFCVSEEGGRIGRHSTNNILVIEESVSRFHASIVYDKKKELFKLMDLKSSTGTYIKIDAQLVLTKDMIIELGSYHFQVTSIRSDQDIAELILLIVEGNPLNKDIRLSCKTSQPTSFKIGRKETNEVFFEDTHMSNVHANISYSNGKFVFEDMSSTNGSWLKLTEDDPTYLENNSVFKIGTLSIYKCQYTDAKRTIDQTRSDNCVVCY
jgi:pSer/pThr/pTyr-binding forkhead associated (FHA) protein